MFNKLNLSVLALMASCAAAPAQEAMTTVVIGAGNQGGGYAATAERMAVQLGQRGMDASVSYNNGSDEITLRACAGQADIWIAQIDAIYARFNEGCRLKPVGSYGNEYAFLLFPPDSRMDELSDMDETTKVGVDGIGSGSELFARTIQSIELGDHGNKSDWAGFQLVESSAQQLNTMAEFGDIDAAILVRKPDSADISLLLDQGWELGELYDKDINDLQFNGKPLYTGEQVRVVSEGGKRDRDYAYEVRSFIGVSEQRASDRDFASTVASVAR